MEKPCLVPIGTVSKTHGVNGAVKLYPYGETFVLLEPGAKLLLVDSGGMPERELTLESIRPSSKKSVIVRFTEITGMEPARELAGKEVFIPEDQLPKPAEGEYYYYQLIGLRVESSDGRDLGRLTAILETGSNDVYVIESEEGKELLVPAIEEVICEIDLPGCKIIVDLPEGLE